MIVNWLSKHSFLGALLDGNGKEKRLLEATKETHEAKLRQEEAILAAGLQTAKLTRQAVEMAIGDNDSDDSADDIDVGAIVREVDQEMACGTLECPVIKKRKVGAA